MDANLQTLVSTVIAVFLEASPFLLLGSFLSALFEVLLPADKIGRYLPQRRMPGLFFGMFAGMLLPTCECGVVSIVRRFLKKDVPPHIAITYMLSAPVINPLVLAATYVAFQGNIWMVLGRAALVAACAGSLGWALSGVPQAQLIRQAGGLSLRDPVPSAGARGDTGYRLNLGHGVANEAGCRCESRPTSRFVGIFLHTASEFMDMGKYVVLAGIIVGLLKVFLPQEALVLFRENISLAIGAMMLLAILLSVCSEADAFVAAAFSTFPAAARLAFVAIGPMVDFKLIFMYAAVFRLPVVLALTVVPTVLVYALSVLLGIMTR
ncbi:MAG: permease [Hyphomicrobiales bacterium]